MNSKNTATKTKISTRTVVKVALGILGVAVVAAAAFSSVKKIPQAVRSRIPAGTSATEIQQRAFICIRGNAVGPIDSKLSNYGIPVAQAAGNIGTLVVEVVDSQGRSKPADIEAWQGGRLIGSFTETTGEGQTGLPAGRYTLRVVVPSENLKGESTVDVLQDRTARHRIRVAAPPSGIAVLRIVDSNGRQTPANLELRWIDWQGQESTRSGSTMRCPTGECEFSIAEGTYRAYAFSQLGSQEVNVRASQRDSYQVTVGSPYKVLGASTTGEAPSVPHDCGEGVGQRVIGNICDENGQLIDTTGVIAVRPASQRQGFTCAGTVSHGYFEVRGDLPNDEYTLQFNHPVYGHIDTNFTLEPKRVDIFVPR